MEKKEFNGAPSDYDNDNYDDIVEADVGVVVPTSTPITNNVVKPVVVTPRELLIYFANRYKEVHGFEHVIDWVKEIAIFKSFIERYNADAQPMVELLFDKHKGKINDMVMTPTAFSKGSKWIQDTLYIELQQNKIKEENRPSSEGLMDTNEFLKRFAI